MTIEKLLQTLQDPNNSLPGEEREVVRGLYSNFLVSCEDAFMSKSGGGEAATFRFARLVEVCASRKNRPKFERRNVQKPAFVIDAKNSRNLPSDYYEDCASDYNSELEVPTRVIPGWGSPFDRVVLTKQPAPDYFLDGAGVKKRMTDFKSMAIKIEYNIGLSGEGQGSRSGIGAGSSHSVKLFVTGPLAPKNMSNGPGTGYAYEAYKAEGMLDSIKAMAGDDVRATMENTPLIRRPQGRSRDSSSNKKARHDLHAQTAALLGSIVSSQGCDQLILQIDSLENRVRADSVSLDCDC